MRRTTAILLGVCLMAFGCSDAGEPLSFQQQLDVLERANFKGRIAVSTGGSPASWTMKQVFSVGPENASFHAAGEVDFSRSPGAELVTPPVVVE